MENTFRGRKIVVTGGAGFIGSHISERLIELGSRVVIIDNLFSGKITNIKHLLKKDNLEFIQETILDLPLLQKCFLGADYVFHQAAIPSVPRSIANPIASNEVNITGTLNVLLSSRDTGVKKVIFASSSSVYGDTPILPKREDMPPNPQSPYALTKLTAEYYCHLFTKLYDLPTICLRYFNVYGPRQDPNSQYAAVIPKFITSISQGKPPIIYGDGEQSRDFTFVQDVVQANLLAAQSDITGIVNVGTNNRVNLNQLARILLDRMNRGDLQLEYEKERPGDVKHSLADISKASSFGYRPEYSIEKGVISTISSILNS